MNQRLWINLYACGTFHRQGKPDTSNIHAGDVYPNEAAAKAAIEPNAGYIDTCYFWASLPGPIYMNGPESIPTPLAETLKGTAPRLPLYHSGDNEWSLETSESEARELPLPWEGPRKAPSSPAKAFKPTHGGYPTSTPSAPVLGRSTALEEFQKFSEETDDVQCS